MCICRDLTLSEPRALELICHDDLLDFTFLTALSDEEKQCIQRLDVSGNDIHQVRAYDLLGFFNLKDLSLSLNALDFIEENAFSNLTSLERLLIHKTLHDLFYYHTICFTEICQTTTSISCH
jgi:hypothetical protein